MSFERPGFNKNSIPILGYGLHRLFTNNDWFHRQDFEDAIPEGPYKRHTIPSRSTVVNVQRVFSESGYLEVESTESSRKGGKKQVMMRATDACIDPLLEVLTFQVTNTGLTLPELLLVPESVQTILVKTDFTQRVIGHVSGAVTEFHSK